MNGTCSINVTKQPGSDRLIIHSDGEWFMDVKRGLTNPALWGYRGPANIEDGKVIIDGIQVYPR